MPPIERHPEDESQLLLPQQLTDDLADLYGPEVPVPIAVDEQVLASARQRLGRRRWARLVAVWSSVGAAAAAVALIVWLNLPSKPAPPMLVEAESVVPVNPRDIDRSGRVDILDAFALARQVERGRPARDEWDFNRDGQVDRDDADAIAVAVVRLNGEMVQ